MTLAVYLLVLLNTFCFFPICPRVALSLFYVLVIRTLALFLLVSSAFFNNFTAITNKVTKIPMKKQLKATINSMNIL